MMIRMTIKEKAKKHCKVCNGKGMVNKIDPEKYSGYPKDAKNRVVLTARNLGICPCRFKFGA